jgi:thiol-disulfide isomerase/thioredoxin
VLRDEAAAALSAGMIERLLVLALLAAAITLGVAATRTWSTSRTRGLKALPGEMLLSALGSLPDGRRTLVAFSTPSCAACHTAQAPAVSQVEGQLGTSNLRIIRVDAASQPEIARAFGVLTVPSTVILDKDGKVAAINHGFAPSGRLVQQLQNA